MSRFDKLFDRLILLFIFYFIGSVFFSNFDRKFDDAPDFSDEPNSYQRQDDEKLELLRKEFAEDNNLEKIEKDKKWSMEVFFKKVLYIFIGDGVKYIKSTNN